MLKSAAFFLGSSFLGCLACYGQVYSASLTGILTDPNQAIIPGASVKIRNVFTSDERQTTTGPTGRYTVSQLLPGTYDLTAEMRGFKVFVNRGLVLLAGQNVEFNVSLQLGHVTQTVQVQGS